MNRTEDAPSQLIAQAIKQKKRAGSVLQLIAAIVLFSVVPSSSVP